MNRRPLLTHGRFIGDVRRGFDSVEFSVSDIVDVGDAVPEHTHVSAHVSFIVAGDYHTGAAGYDGTCAGGALLYNPPFTTHRDRFAAAGGRFLTLSLTDSLLETVGQVGSLPAGSMGLPETETGLLGSRLLLELGIDDPCSTLGAESLLLELLERLRRRRTEERSAPPWLAQACDYLRAASCRSLRIRQVAAAVEVHPVHLARAFRRFLGCTPGDYLRRVRVGAAARAIARGAALAEVAHDCGFGDQAHMSKSFRRVLGATPGAYRRAIRT